MWCQNCQQDVPAIAASDSARCAQCGRFLKRDIYTTVPTLTATESTDWEADLGQPADEAAATATTPSAQPIITPFNPDEDWALAEQVRSLQHRLNLPVISSAAASQSVAAPASLASQTALYIPSPHHPADQHQAGARRRNSILAWGMMSLGLMAFVCGGVLLAWSFLGHRSDLWHLGMPLTLAGQFALLIGLVLQLDHLWHNRRTTETLENVDRQLHEINHSATLLRTSNAPPGQSFYAHLAEGAHPHLLLTDLKGQLDLLANKLSQH